MFKNYLKIAWRNLKRDKSNSFINIGGLSLGIAATLLIGMWVYNELSYNQEITNYKSIAQVMQNQTFAGEINTSNNQPMQLAPVLRDKYGDHFKHVVTSSFTNSRLLSYNENKISRPGNFMEPGITDMLGLNMLEGSYTALEDPSSIILSKSTSEALFGDESPMGKTIELGTTMKATVAGIYDDLPINSDFRDLTFIAPWHLLKTTQNYEERLGWGNNWFQTFVETQNGSSMKEISAIIKNAKFDNIDASYQRTKPEVFLHPMDQWHLHSEFENGIVVGGRIEMIWLFSIIGIFILLLACINFMNLATARSVKRSKEVGIRKTIGSQRKQLVFQFFGESLLIVLLAFIVSVALTIVMLPFFNALIEKSLALPWANPYFWFVSIAFILFTAIVSGIYPAFYLSSFKPAKVLKGEVTRSTKAGNFRKSLVVFQFAISIALIIATITVNQQIQHAKERPLGYNTERMLYVPINTAEVINSFGSLREELVGLNGVEDVAASDVRITGTYTTNGGFNWKGKDPNMSEEFRTLRATYGFGEMVDWEILQGRNFSRDFKSDSLAMILNETAVAYMGLKDPIGEIIQWGDDEDHELFKVIGVVKDMVTISPYEQAKPSMMILHYGRFLNFVNIKLKAANDINSTIAQIENIFGKYDPQSIFDYRFLQDDYANNFVEEEKIGTLASIFSFMAILISCLGIFGLAAFMAEQRTKEIGIRKVLGASYYQLLSLLSKDFLVLVCVAACIAIPIGIFYMGNWLENYDYRTSIKWWIPAISLVLTLGITLLTASFQTVKVVLKNPVKSLRTE